MSNFFAEQGRTRVYAETDFMSVAGKNPRRTPFSGKMAIYGWTLAVARQPAVHIRLFFFMTGDAKSHFKMYTFDSVHGFDCTVALLAGNFAVNVALVIEQHMLWNIVYFFPRCRGFRIVISVFLLNPRMFRDYIFMAMKTFFHRRDPRVVGIGDIWMTVFALNLFYPGM